MSTTPAPAVPRIDPYATLPAWSILGVICGLLLSWQAVPPMSYWQPDALIWPAVFLSLGILAGVGAAGLRSPAAGFRTEHLLLFGLFYWVLLDPMQSAYPLFSISLDGVHRAFLGVGVFALFLWFGSKATSLFRTGLGGQPLFQSRDVGKEFLFWAACGCFVLGLLRLFIGCQLNPVCMYDYYFLPRFAGGIRGWHGNFGQFDTILIQFKFAGYLILPIAAALHYVERRVSWRVVVVSILGLIFLLYLMKFGGRRGVGTTLGATILMWILLHERIRFKHILGLVAAAAALLIIMQAMLAWRSVGTLQALSEGRPLEVTDRGGVIAVDKNFRAMSQVMTIVPEQHPHTGTTGIVYMLTIFIPRSVFPGKPAGRGFDLPASIGQGDRSGWSWTCSSVCDLYLIGGFVAVAIGGFLYGVAANLISRLLYQPVTVRSRLIFAILSMTLFVGLRSLHEVVATGLAALALWGVLVARRAVMTRKRIGPEVQLQRYTGNPFR